MKFKIGTGGNHYVHVLISSFRSKIAIRVAFDTRDFNTRAHLCCLYAFSWKKTLNKVVTMATKDGLLLI